MAQIYWKACQAAALGDSAKMNSRLAKLEPGVCLKGLFERAAEYGQLAILQELVARAQGGDPGAHPLEWHLQGAIMDAAQRGHVAAVDYLLDMPGNDAYLQPICDMICSYLNAGPVLVKLHSKGITPSIQGVRAMILHNNAAGLEAIIAQLPDDQIDQDMIDDAIAISVASARRGAPLDTNCLAILLARIRPVVIARDELDFWQDELRDQLTEFRNDPDPEVAQAVYDQIEALF